MSDAPPKDEKAAAPAGAPNPMVPVIILLVAMPLISFGMTQYVLIPKIKASVASAAVAAPSAEAGAEHQEAPAGGHGGEEKKAAAHGGGEEKKGGEGEKKEKKEKKEEKKGGHGGGEKKEKGSEEGGDSAFSHDFSDIVVNLSGAKGTRYLKVSFTVFSTDSEIKELIQFHKNELLDLTLSVLSSKTLADLEAPGAKNMLRHDLIENFNQVLKGTVVDQIYFSEFVIQ